MDATRAASWRDAIEAILPCVNKPARYLGNEWNSSHKDWDSVEVHFALGFPDIYEIGMSNLGGAIMYHEINRRGDALAERVFAPWTDMEAGMREVGVPLFSLESWRPARDFDFLGFSLQYEMLATNVLNMLDLAGVPQKAAVRGLNDPFVVAGGPCAVNAEPLVDYIDFFVLGEAEQLIHQLLDAFLDWRRAGRPGGRGGFLARIAGLQGSYIPSFYDVTYHADGRISAITVNDAGRQAGAPERPQRRIVIDLDSVNYPTKPIVPYTEPVFDRMMVEVFRGCSRGCRFCHAGMSYRPVRERSPEKVKELARELAKNTGHHELSLVSLATNDYGAVQDVLCDLAADLTKTGINVSLPSLRVDAYSVELADQVQAVRKSGLTLAPEAGTQRLRDVINKGVSEENFLQALEAAFRAGWDSVKLYFMIGLPTETDEDLDGIVHMAHQAIEAYRKVRGPGRRRLQVTVSTSSFVPKAHTPFQWEPQTPLPELERRQAYLRSRLRHPAIKYRWHRPQISLLEATLSRGDRRLGKVLERAWKKGCKFDGWEEHFKYEAWLEAFREEGLDPGWYAQRCFTYDDILPWEHLDTGIRKEFLVKDHLAAMQAAGKEDCRWDRCKLCGVCLDRPGVRIRLKPGDKVRMAKPGTQRRKVAMPEAEQPDRRAPVQQP